MSSMPPWLANADNFPKKSILTPIGALAVAVFAVSVSGAVYTDDNVLRWLLMGIGALPVAVAIWSYIYFAIKEPDRLQTEDYRIQKEMVAKLVTYVDGKQVILDPKDTALTGGSLNPREGG